MAFENVSLTWFWRAACVSMALAVTACGGGGKDGGAAASPQSINTGVNNDGRKTFVWSFESERADSKSAHVFDALRDGQPTTVTPIRACASGLTNCKVQIVSGKKGKGLRFLPFDPSAWESFAWIEQGSGASICASDGVQYDPFGKYDFRMTLAMWFKPEALEAKQTYHLFGAGDPISLPGFEASAFHLRLVDGFVQMTFYPDAYADLPDLKVTAPTPIQVSNTGDNWHHVAVVYDNLQVRLYVDGKLEASALRDAKNKRVKEPCRPTYLGGMSTTGGFDGAPKESNSYIFPGVIDEVVLSSKAFTETEVLNLISSASATQ